MSKKIEDMTQPEINALMQGLAQLVDGRIAAVCGMTGRRPMFTLLVFDDPKVAQYVSSCERAQMPTALREAADRIEKNQDLIEVERRR